MTPAPTNPGDDHSQGPPQRKWISRLAELVLWSLFPFALLVVVALISVALGIHDLLLPILIAFGGVLAVGFVFLVWPNRRLGIGRKRAVLLLTLGLVVSAPLASMASLTPQQRAELEARAEEAAAREEAERDAAAREGAAREAAQREAAASAQREAEAAAAATSQREPEIPGQPSTEAQASFLQTHTTFMRLANRCDSAWATMTEAIGTDDPYVSYRAADGGADICRDVSVAMGRLEFSNLVERDTRRALNRAVDACSYAMFARQSAMERAARIFDGNMRPSAVEGFRQRAGLAQQQIIECMVSYLGAASGGGYELEDLDSEGD